MLAEHARPFTSAPKESPIGSWPLPLTPVDFPDMRVAMCRPPRDPRLIRTNAGATAFPPTAHQHDPRLQSIFFLLPDPLQLQSAPLNPETCSKSVACHPAARHLTESLVAKPLWLTR